MSYNIYICCANTNKRKDGKMKRFAFTMAAGTAGSATWTMVRRYAFTMAEILLSLTIIGVVAAITLPSLTGNINERTWNTQRKALYARISQAISLMPALNGYGIGETLDETRNNAAEIFISSGLSRVLKINNVCSFDKLADCGISSQYTTMDAQIKDFPTTLLELNDTNIVAYEIKDPYLKAVGFETQNGESIALFYNPYCLLKSEETDDFVQPRICANFIYDLNGSKGPNTVGKDIGFISALYPTDSVVVAPMPLSVNAQAEGVEWAQAVSICKEQNKQPVTFPQGHNRQRTLHLRELQRNICLTRRQHNP